MAYNNPTSSEAVRLNVGLDIVLKSLKDAFVSKVPWLNGNVFLRAYQHRFNDNETGKNVSPEIYMGESEYYNSLFNDNLPAAIFFKTDGAEKILFERPNSIRNVTYQRKLSLIFWGNLKEITATYKADYIYTESIKEEFIEVLGRNSNIFSIDQFVDDPIEEVFKDYDLPKDRQLGRHPYAGIRIDFTVQYNRPTVRC